MRNKINKYFVLLAILSGVHATTEWSLSRKLLLKLATTQITRGSIFEDATVVTQNGKEVVIAIPFRFSNGKETKMPIRFDMPEKVGNIELSYPEVTKVGGRLLLSGTSGKNFLVYTLESNGNSFWPSQEEIIIIPEEKITAAEKIAGLVVGELNRFGEQKIIIYYSSPLLQKISTPTQHEDGQTILKCGSLLLMGDNLFRVSVSSQRATLSQVEDVCEGNVIEAKPGQVFRIGDGDFRVKLIQPTREILVQTMHVRTETTINPLWGVNNQGKINMAYNGIMPEGYTPVTGVEFVGLGGRLFLTYTHPNGVRDFFPFLTQQGFRPNENYLESRSAKVLEVATNTAAVTAVNPRAVLAEMASRISEVPRLDELVITPDKYCMQHVECNSGDPKFEKVWIFCAKKDATLQDGQTVTVGPKALQVNVLDGKPTLNPTAPTRNDLKVNINDYFQIGEHTFNLVQPVVKQNMKVANFDGSACWFISPEGQITTSDHPIEGWIPLTNVTFKSLDDKLVMKCCLNNDKAEEFTVPFVKREDGFFPVLS